MDKKQPDHEAIKDFFNVNLSAIARANRAPEIVEIFEFLKGLYYEHVFGDKNAGAAIPNVITASFNGLECKYVSMDHYEKLQEELNAASEILENNFWSKENA